MRSIFLIFALSALLSAQAFQLNLDFLNDQSWATLGTPFIWTGFGSHSECFDRLDYSETGRFTATSDYKENLDGVLSIPIYKDSNTDPLNLNIYWNFNDLENPEVIVFLDSTKGEASLNSTAFTIASANYSPISWSTISLGWGFYAATYLSDGIYLNDEDSQNVNVRLFWDPKLTNGNYTIYTWKAKYAVSNWDAKTSSRNLVVQQFQTNPTDGWQKYTITNIFDDVYTIQPLDYQSINTTNYIAAAPVNSTSGSFIEQPFVKTGRQFLWRIATNDWGLWTISLHGADLFWGLGNDNAALGDRILLQTEFNGDFTQKFYFVAA